jgi:two-component system, LytTR family, response regulator
VRRIAEARSLRASLEPASEIAADERYLRHIVISERGRQLLIPVAEVEWIEADTYYVRIHSCGRIRLLRERLAKLEASLDPDLFVRTHRSALARTDLIREIRAQSPYSYTAVLTTGARVPVSRERLKRVTASLVR